jgi:ABC-type glycerol-3-phosphate transport system substrate-binding protein
MYRKLGLIIALLIVLIGAGAVLAEILVCVKKGDWIEYQVTFTGTPPPDHDITWARMEIVDVQGKAIDLNITTEFSNGNLLHETITLNLETGQLGDDFIIPANLNKGDAFLDKY